MVKPLGYASIRWHDGQRRALYTHVLTDAELADVSGVSATARLVQRFVEDKDYELRLTVVGTENPRLFPVAIRASSPAAQVDFRSDYSSLSHSIATVPGEVATGVVRFMRTFGIELGNFDFCVDQSGRHWFLECNGSGGQ